MVTHQSSTIRNAAGIAVVKDGMTVEQGKHDELMVNEGRAIRCTLGAQFVEKMTRWKRCSSHDNTMVWKCQLGEFLRLTRGDHLSAFLQRAFFIS